MGAYTLKKAKESQTEHTLYQDMLNYLERENDKQLFESLLRENNERNQEKPTV